MTAQKTEFENGVILTTFTAQENDVSIDLIIPSGHSDKVPEAHFLEHMTFKSNTYKNAEKIVYELEGKAIRYDGWTSDDRTHFHMLSPPEHITTAIQILFECFSNKQFNLEEVELEKNILKSELGSTLLNPFSTFEKKLKSTVFHNHPLNVQEETYENIQAVTPETLINAKQRLFFTYDFVIGVSGQINRNELVKMVAETFGSLKKTKQKKQHLPAKEHKHHEEFEERADIDSGCVLVAFPVIGIDHSDSYIIDFISHLLGGSMGGYAFSNRLFQEIRAKKGLAYEVHTLYEKYPGVGMFILSSSGMKKEHVPIVKKIILNQLEQLKTKDIPRGEFKRVKTNILVNVYRNLYTRIQSISGSMGLAELYGIPWGYELFKQQIDSLTPEKIREVANTYFDGQYFIGEVVPKK